MLKEFLSKKGIQYVSKDVSVDRMAGQEMVARSGQNGVPVTSVDGEMIVGYDPRKIEETLNRHAGQRRPPFGATIADASSITAKQGVVPTFGAFVGSVRAGSVAERTGLAPGDIITELNIQPISNADGLERALSALGSGSRFTLVVLRGGKTYTLEGMF